MTIGEVFEKGILDNTNTMMSVDAKSMLCLYRVVRTQEEYEALFPTTLSEQNVGEGIL